MSESISRPLPPAHPASSVATSGATETDETTCPHCGESRELAKVKGCIKCLRCGFKFDCNGW